MKALRPLVIMSLASLAIFLFLFVPALTAQKTSSAVSPPQPFFRDPQAIALIQNTIDKMGGTDRVRSITSWTVTGTQSLPSTGKTGPARWEFAGDEIRQDVVMDGQSSTLTSGHGRPAIQNPGGIHAVHLHVLHAMFHPGLITKDLQRALDDPHYSLEYLGLDESGAQTMVRTTSHAAVVDLFVTPRVWYIDNSTGLPTKMTYRMPDANNPANYGRATAILGNYQTINGMLIPLSVGTYMGNKQLESIQIDNVAIDASISDSDFAPLLGARQ
jgi:hypothetical protein